MHDLASRRIHGFVGNSAIRRLDNCEHDVSAEILLAHNPVGTPAAVHLDRAAALPKAPPRYIIYVGGFEMADSKLEL